MYTYMIMILYVTYNSIRMYICTHKVWAAASIRCVLSNGKDFKEQNKENIKTKSKEKRKKKKLKQEKAINFYVWKRKTNLRK